MELKGNGQGLAKLLGILMVAAALAGCGGASGSGSSGATSSTISSPNSTANATVALSSSHYLVEPASSAIVTVYRAGSSAGAATVGYSTIDGSAAAGTDYVATSGNVTWPDGDSSARTVVVPVAGGASGKNFAIALTSINGSAAFGSPASATIQVASSGTASSGGSSSSGSSGGGSSSSGTTTGTKTATLAWTAPTENTNGTVLTDLTGYNIYYGSSTSAMINKISITTVGILTYVIDNLSSGSWYFAVTSVNRAGVESGLSSAVGATL